MMAKYRMYTGPVYVKEISESMKKVSGVSNVYDGTEHVYFDFDGGDAALTVRVQLSVDAVKLRSFVPHARVMR